jgi:hypothetical protein
MTRPQTVVEAKPCRACKQYPMLEQVFVGDNRVIGWNAHCHGGVAGVTRDETVRAWNEMQESK